LTKFIALVLPTSSPMQLEEMVHDKSHPLVNIKAMLLNGDVPDLLLVGPPGTGKTTTAHALAKDLNADLHEFNASDERGIDFIRTRVKQVATQRGYADCTVILLDEADGLTRQAQDALRRTIETGHALFILTANEEASIIPAIRSRCHTLKFRPYNPAEVAMFVTTHPSMLKGLPYDVSEGLCTPIASAYHGDLRKIGMAVEAAKDFKELQVMAGEHSKSYSEPALSLIGGDWEALRRELMALESTSNLAILNRLHDKVRQLDMEPTRFHHYSRIWGDAVLAAHQWPLNREGFIDWFVGSLSSLWGKEEEK